MTLQPGRPARSSASYLFSLRGRNSPAANLEWLWAQVGPGAESVPRYGPLVHVVTFGERVCGCGVKVSWCDACVGWCVYVHCPRVRVQVCLQVQ